MGANKLFLDLSRRARLIAFLLALIFSQKEALALEDFLMAVPSKTICSAYLFIGKDQGFFTAEGIDLKLVLIPVSVAQMAIMAQQVDGMEYSGNGVSMRANGAPVAMVFSETYKPSWFLFANSSIKHLKQLSGKSVSVGVLGSGSHTMTIAVLKEAGLDSNSVVFLGGRGGSDVRMQMLANGFVPPMMWFHQHFSTSPKPIRFVAFHPPGMLAFPGWSGEGSHFIGKGANQIEYFDEDPGIRRLFEEELVRKGLKSNMPREIYLKPKV